MKRYIDDYLLQWKSNARRKPLLLRGARQVGKTYAVRSLGKSFKSCVEINFELMPEMGKVFEKDLQPDRIIRDISYLLEKDIIPGETLLFFDEIQNFPAGITALRYFYEMVPELHVIAAGSLLDFEIKNIGMPVGRVMSLYMYPLSFIEFLWAIEHDLVAQELMTPKIHVLSDIVHKKLLELVGNYIAIGGMPEAVQTWKETKNLALCSQVHRTILDTYTNDFAKYAEKFQIKYVSTLFKNAPLQLGQPYKYSNVEGEYRKRELAPSLDLLETAGLIHKVYNSSGNGIPLGAEIDPGRFKIVFLDIGLSQALLGLKTGEWIFNPLQELVNKGELVESFVGQELLAYEDPFKKEQLYYWQRLATGSEAEIDYLIQKNEHIIPLEVKSGAGTTLKSMHLFLESHPKSPYGIRFSIQNYSKFQKIYSYPLYAIHGALSFDFSTNDSQ